MERLKRTFSFRKKPPVPEANKPHQWQEDEQKVRNGTCSFQVRYLGSIEVFEQRGIQVCEEGVKALKAMNKGKKFKSAKLDKKSDGVSKRHHKGMWSRLSMRRKKSKNKDEQSKGKYQRAILYVSGDALRVVDEISQGLIVDQTIEKVSFCAPDRHNEKGFAYICRDGTSRRWNCYGFLAVKDSGERLSHAVGCAFTVCLERRQKREKESVSVSFNEKGTSFTRTGSFRQTTLTERMADPQSAIIPEPVKAENETNGTDNTAHAQQAVDMALARSRPAPSADMLNRQASFRGFNKLADNSPFKKQYSLRLNELPSNIARQQQLRTGLGGASFDSATGRADVILEESPSHEEGDISDLCKQIEGLSTELENEPPSRTPFVQPKNPTASPFGGAPQHAVQVHSQSQNAGPFPTQQPSQQQPQAAASSHIPSSQQQTQQPTANTAQPIRQMNPWETPPAFRQEHFRQPTPAESWLQSTAVMSSSPTPPPPTGGVTNGVTSAATTAAPFVTKNSVQFPTGGNNGHPHTPPPGAPQRTTAPHAPMLGSTPRAHTVDNPSSSTHTQVQWFSPPPKAPTLKELQLNSQMENLMANTSSSTLQQNGGIAGGPPPPATNSPWTSQPLGPTSSDPFDAAWATRSPNTKPASSNPFQSTGDATVTQSFKMQV